MYIRVHPRYCNLLQLWCRIERSWRNEHFYDNHLDLILHGVLDTGFNPTGRRHIILICPIFHPALRLLSLYKVRLFSFLAGSGRLTSMNTGFSAPLFAHNCDITKQVIWYPQKGYQNCMIKLNARIISVGFICRQEFFITKIIEYFFTEIKLLIAEATCIDG